MSSLERDVFPYALWILGGISLGAAIVALPSVAFFAFAPMGFLVTAAAWLMRRDTVRIGVALCAVFTGLSAFVWALALAVRSP